MDHNVSPRFTIYVAVKGLFEVESAESDLANILVAHSRPAAESTMTGTEGDGDANATPPGRATTWTSSAAATARRVRGKVRRSVNPRTLNAIAAPCIDPASSTPSSTSIASETPTQIQTA